MKISEDTNSVINYLTEYSSNTLRKQNDLAILFELGAASLNDELMNNIIFTGSSIYKMHKSIQRQNNSGLGSENIPALEKELKNSMLIFVNYLSKLIDNAEETVKSRFDKIYFLKERGALLNLIDLSHDFAKFKELQNDMNHSK
ncbi:MAG: hypothetical protein A2X64_00665 [Ignavibacteria bacterium GWF2_33_9]|nr:MAG: hypothetical protein A2X64_00665 [Ignavibacteria bacterium GWF2_33_9]